MGYPVTEFVWIIDLLAGPVSVGPSVARVSSKYLELLEFARVLTAHSVILPVPVLTFSADGSRPRTSPVVLKSELQNSVRHDSGVCVPAIVGTRVLLR